MMKDKLTQKCRIPSRYGFVMLCFLALLSSCGPFSPRPPVILTRSPTIVDYMDDEIEIDNTLYALEHRPPENPDDPEKVQNKKALDRARLAGGQELFRRGEKQPLEPAYFDPYQPLIKEYRFAPGDMIEISVFGQADTVVNEAVIAPDGRLYYMFLEGILAAGKTSEELRVEIADKIKNYFIEPEVSIIPRRISGQQFMILGQVVRPGLYPIGGSTTLQQAIGGAGGIALGGYAGTTINIANLRGSFIVRNGRKLDVDFERLVMTDGFEQNIFVRPGDYIYIASSLYDYVYLIGEVRENLPIPYKDGMTLAQLMSGVSGSTEGWTDRTYITRVIIVRGSLDCPMWYEVNLLKVLLGEARDVYLLPGDIVYAQKKPFGFGRELVRLAINAYMSGFVGTAGNFYSSEVFHP